MTPTTAVTTPSPLAAPPTAAAPAGPPTAPVVGSFAVANTGGWGSWRVVPANVDWPKGTHDLYITFTSGQPANFVNVDWLTFS